MANQEYICSVCGISEPFPAWHYRSECTNAPIVIRSHKEDNMMISMTANEIASTIYTFSFHEYSGNVLALARQFAAALEAIDDTFQSEPFIRACTTGVRYEGGTSDQVPDFSKTH